ncbi:acyl-homoserine-lactone synthase [Oceaniglobus roseus]|uniref:acyl-homoserine-lactone synthase n=1 Tax=Oceaniglobus roseus TaxID=1737570 RepID=UPI0031843EFB
MTGTDLHTYPNLRDSMFADRARQFRDRLRWEVPVDAAGFERDQYDPLDPLYILWERSDGRHGGSMRCLPTTGRTMLADHFAHLATPPSDPGIWECTRFCLSPGAPAHVSAAILLGALEFGLHHGLSHLVGVFDARMLRVYGRIGWSPAVQGQEGEGRHAICAGLWSVTPAVRPVLLRRAGVSGELSEHWCRRAFGPRKLPRAA